MQRWRKWMCLLLGHASVSTRSEVSLYRNNGSRARVCGYRFVHTCTRCDHSSAEIRWLSNTARRQYMKVLAAQKQQQRKG